MRVYCGRNRKGKWKASLDYEKVSKMDCLMETELPIVHEKVYLIKTYYGVDYNYGSEYNPIYDVVRYSDQVFHSVGALKKSDIWKEREEMAKRKPDDFHVTDFSIASDDYGGAFIYGDVMMGMFNMEIIGVKVY